MIFKKFLRKSQEELEAANQLSLQEINNTVDVPKEGSFLRMSSLIVGREH